MNVCIHRGTKEVGGSCVEVESQGSRILIDIGLPLDQELGSVPLPPVSGLEQNDPSLLGILISHLHLDHYGLANKIEVNVPFIISQGAIDILNASNKLFPNEYQLHDAIIIENKKPITLGPFTATPYLMDHSAYDAYAFLIEADQKRVFYTGDFRGHGRKKKLFENLLNNPPTNVDALLLEGSTIGRTDTTGTCLSENDLEKQFIEHFDKAEGLSLVWTSAQNIDRLVTIYKACRQTGKTLVVDLYTANILRSINNLNIPKPGWRQIKVYVPKFQRVKIKELKLFEFAKEFRPHRIYADELEQTPDSFVFLFRPSMTGDFEGFATLDKAIMVYSLWGGYLKESRYVWFNEWLKERDIPIYHCHTSGHAQISDLQRLAKSIEPTRIVPIHTFNPQLYPKLFDNVQFRDDGDWWSV